LKGELEMEITPEQLEALETEITRLKGETDWLRGEVNRLGERVATLELDGSGRMTVFDQIGGELAE